MKNTFWSIKYKGEYIAGHFDGPDEIIQWRSKRYVSLHAAKLAVTRYLKSASPSFLHLPISA